MKKLFSIFAFCFLLSLQGLSHSGSMTAFAAVDTDSDGVADEKDMCPRVYSRSTTGCPALEKVISLPTLNICYQKIQGSRITVRVQPICDTKTQTCPVLSGVSGVQSCDIIFPLILRDGQPFVRGSIFVVDFTRS